MRICLLGKSLTNLVLANVLANKKLEVDIYYTSKLDLQKSDSPRTLAISNENYTYLKKNKKKLNLKSWPTQKINIYIEKKSSEKLYEFKNSNKNNFFLIKYNEIYNSFLKDLKKNKYINFIKSKKKSDLHLINKKYNLIINTETKSNITKKFFSKKFEKNYYSSAYTLIISHKKIKNNIAMQIFTKHGPLAYLPLSNFQTSIVFSYSGKNKIDYNEIKKKVVKFSNKYEITKFGKIENFQLKFSSLRNYHYNNILSFGDLIHKVHPLAGQGFNMNIRDIKILSEIIDAKICLGLEIDSSVASDFEKKTKHLNFIYGSGLDFIYNFFNLDNRLNNSISDPLFKLFRKNNILNNYATYFSDKGINI